MRLGIDASNLRLGGGVTHLVEVLGAAQPERFGFSRVVVWGGERILAKLPAREWLSAHHPPALDAGLLRRAFWQRFELSPLARQSGCDLLFVPGGAFAGDFRPVVTMCRNMLPFEWREVKRYGASLRTLKFLLLRRVQARAFRQADGVIFLTDYARDRVLKEIGALQGAARNIAHGVSHRFLARPRPQRDKARMTPADPCRLVYVSVTEPYKHHWHVVDAVARLRSRGVPIELDLAGPPGAAHRRLTRALRRHDPSGAFIRYRGELSAAGMSALYARADIAVFASSCENMPNILVEAMASGLPIACSNLGPMPEVLGEGGVYFHPERPEEIAAAIDALLQSAALREQKAATAFERASRLSWAACADATFEFLAALASRRESQPGGSRSRAY